MDSLNDLLEVYMYIGPEKCGKTEMALNLFTATPDEEAFFITTDDEIDGVREFLKERGLFEHVHFVKTIDNFLAENEMKAYLYGSSNPCIIFDNYFDYTLNQRIAAYRKIHSVISRYDVHVFGTPHKLYDVTMLDQIRQSKQKHSLMKTVGSSDSENIREAFFNFLTDPNADIKMLSRPITKEELNKYSSQIEHLLTRCVGLHERI
jgi:hypothetical protein